MRRQLAHRGALALRRVAGAHLGADRDIGKAARREFLANAGERDFEVFLDVVGERLERRDIDDLRLIFEAAFEALFYEVVDRGEKGGERLARAGRGGEQHMAAGLDRGPSLLLGRGRRGEAAREPGGDCGMEQREGGHRINPSGAERQDKRRRKPPGEIPPREIPPGEIPC